MATLLETSLFRQITTLNDQIMEENNKISQVLTKFLHSHSRPQSTTPSLFKRMEEQKHLLKSCTDSNIKLSRSIRSRHNSEASQSPSRKSQKRPSSCSRLRQNSCTSLKQSEKSRLLGIRSYTSPPGRVGPGCGKQSQISKLKKLSMKMFPRVSNEFLFANRSKALNLNLNLKL